MTNDEKIKAFDKIINMVSVPVSRVEEFDDIVDEVRTAIEAQQREIEELREERAKLWREKPDISHSLICLQAEHDMMIGRVKRYEAILRDARSCLQHTLDTTDFAFEEDASDLSDTLDKIHAALKESEES